MKKEDIVKRLIQTEIIISFGFGIVAITVLVPGMSLEEIIVRFVLALGFGLLMIIKKDYLWTKYEEFEQKCKEERDLKRRKEKWDKAGKLARKSLKEDLIRMKMHEKENE